MIYEVTTRGPRPFKSLSPMLLAHCKVSDQRDSIDVCFCVDHGYGLTVMSHMPD